MTIPKRFSLVTLGVADVVAATTFYRALGWQESSASMPGDVSFFATPGGVLGLWGIRDLAADAGLADAAADVAALTDAAADVAALTVYRGGRCGHQPRLGCRGGCGRGDVAGCRGHTPSSPREDRVGWLQRIRGGPDGNLWELAHNPFWPLDDRSMPTLPGPAAG